MTGTIAAGQKLLATALNTYLWVCLNRLRESEDYVHWRLDHYKNSYQQQHDHIAATQTCMRNIYKLHLVNSS